MYFYHTIITKDLLLLHRSRVIVKNLPKHFTQQKFGEHFTQFGDVTDVKLLTTPYVSISKYHNTNLFFRNGDSRRLGFIGFRDEKTAERAIQKLNNTFIGTCRISVAVAKPVRIIFLFFTLLLSDSFLQIGSEELERPWSKYSKGSSAYDKKHNKRKAKDKSKETEDKAKSNRKITDKNDPRLLEFLGILLAVPL